MYCTEFRFIEAGINSLKLNKKDEKVLYVKKAYILFGLNKMCILNKVAGQMKYALLLLHLINYLQ